MMPEMIGAATESAPALPADDGSWQATRQNRQLTGIQPASALPFWRMWITTAKSKSSSRWAMDGSACCPAKANLERLRKMQDQVTLTQIRMIADRFVEWQTPYGRPDPDRCPFVTPGKCISTRFHSPTFMAIGLYRAFEDTSEIVYKEAADRYIAFYLSCMRDPPTGGQRQDYPSYPYQYGMALAGFEMFRKHNPAEDSMDGKAAALYEWLARWKWEQGSYFRNGYGSERHGVIDSANSDDNCHMGRGLIGYYHVSGRRDVLYDAEGLARYYLTEAQTGSYDGCWSSALGTWVVAPTIIDSFEHFRGQRSCEMGWGFSSVGAIEFLCKVAAVTGSAELKQRIAEKCARSMRWQFEACQFEDGSCGMRGRDDKWLGMTAGAILSYLRTRDAGLLSEETIAQCRPRALAAKDWIREHLTPETVLTGGYFKVTGDSEPRPPENQAWMLGWTLDALGRFEQI